jgi:hypothetical protein
VAGWASPDENFRGLGHISLLLNLSTLIAQLSTPDLGLSRQTIVIGRMPMPRSRLQKI